MLRKPLRYFWIGAVLLIPWFGSAGSPSDSLELTLNQAISVALEQHWDVRKAALDLQRAGLELEAAWTRSTIPSITLQVTPPSLSMGGFTDEIQGAFGIGLSLPWGTSSELSAGLDVVWDSKTGEWQVPAWGIVFSHKLDFARLDAGSEELQAKKQAVLDARSSLEESHNAIVLDTIAAYSDLLSTEALLGQAQKDLRQAQVALSQVEQQVEAGLKGEAALLEAKLDVLGARIELEEYRSTYEADKEAFRRVVVGIDQEFELVPFELLLEELKEAAIELLAQGNIEKAALEAPQVQAAQEKVADAKEAVRVARADALPKLSVEAGVDEQGWRVGWNVAFDLFSPDRFLGVEIALVDLELAEVQLEASKEQVENSILNQQAALRKALEDLERLPLEEEKWALEETVKRGKFEAGLLSTEEWDDFQEEKNRFYQTAGESEVSLLLSYLAYRDALGLDLNWEKWVK